MFELTRPEDLYKDLFDFRRDFDDIFSRLMTVRPLTKEWKGLEKYSFVPPVEAWIEPDNKKFYLRVSLPGIDPKDVKVLAHNKNLIISGARNMTEMKKDANYLHREFIYGGFERIIPLPEGVDVDKLSAESSHGVLEIVAPMAAAALPRKIEVKPVLKKAA